MSPTEDEPGQKWTLIYCVTDLEPASTASRAHTHTHTHTHITASIYCVQLKDMQTSCILSDVILLRSALILSSCGRALSVPISVRLLPDISYRGWKREREGRGGGGRERGKGREGGREGGSW